jgi:Zn finger protein HypA/HybF involved in hydrogenase expression
MAEFICPKCISPIIVSDAINSQIKEQVALIIRNGDSRFRGIESLRKIGIDLYEAKGIILHITSNKGECHHCKTKLKKAEENCPKCKRLNFDW